MSKVYQAQDPEGQQQQPIDRLFWQAKAGILAVSRHFGMLSMEGQLELGHLEAQLV